MKSKRVFRLALAGLMAAAVAPAVLAVPVLAQSGGGGNPAIILCQNGFGCYYSDESGDFPTGDLEALLGAPDSYGHNIVVCTAEAGCVWSPLNSDDLDTTYGGSGTTQFLGTDFDEGEADEMMADEGITFSEDEADEMMGDAGMSFDEAEADSVEPDSILDDIDAVSAINVTPQSGLWTSNQYPGTAVCDIGAMEFPAGPPQTGTLTVSQDGSAVTPESLVPDAPPFQLQRVRGGHYRGSQSIDGGTLTVDLLFTAEGLAQGRIHGNVTQEGITCDLVWRFWMVAGDGDLTPETDDTEPEIPDEPEMPEEPEQESEAPELVS
ncbi:MAG: hypothetical protein GYB65_13550 [Chloroflexi bacterium]|nr:hypothetical protein [Chloroflexota bacterium]